MSNKIAKQVFDALAQGVRDNSRKLRDLNFPTNATAATVVSTADLRLDVHKNTKDPSMATGIIQANSGAPSKSVQQYIKGSTGGHSGTHQVIGKVEFGLGDSYSGEELARAVQQVGLGVRPVKPILAESSKSNEWIWSPDDQNFKRQTEGGEEELWKAKVDAAEWTWSSELKRHFLSKADGKYDFHPKPTAE